TITLVGRAVRGARSHHARRAAARVPGPAGAAAQERDLRDARHARGGAGGRPDCGGGGRAAPRGRDAGGAAREPRPRGAGAGGRVMLHEVLVETGRHVMLVGVSVGLAAAIGVPRGVGLTGWPGGRVATVIGIGVATIAAAIGAGGLGVFIFRGVAMVDNRTILAGALPAAALAVGAELALSAVERRVRPPR